MTRDPHHGHDRLKIILSGEVVLELDDKIKKVYPPSDASCKPTWSPPLRVTREPSQPSSQWSSSGGTTAAIDPRVHWNLPPRHGRSVTD